MQPTQQLSPQPYLRRVPPAGSRSSHPHSRKMQYTLGFLVVFASILSSFLLITPTIKFTSDNIFIIATFAAIGVWSLTALYLTMYERPFTLNCTHWVFMLFFLSYAPLVQFLTDSFPGQADVGAFESVGLKTNGILLLWCACYSVTYYMVTHARLKRKPPVLLPPQMTKPNYPWLVLFCLGCTALAVVTTGFSALTRQGPGG